MGFLSGAFLAGLVAIAGPIIFHMIRRTPSGKVPFSTLMFLEPSPPRITKRSRIDHWLLLLLRALALTLLAFAFARPFLRSVETEQTDESLGQRVAVVIDTSASMRRSGLWEQAKRKAIRTFEKAKPGDQMALYTFDRNARVIVGFEAWSKLEPSNRAEVLKKRIDALAPTWAATDLGTVLALAAEDLESLEMSKDDKAASVADGLIHLVSDMQQGSVLDSLQDYEWPDSVVVEVDSVSAKNKTNAGLELMAQPDAQTDQVRIRVTNAADSNTENFNLKWLDQSGSEIKEPRPVYVAPGRSRIVSFTPPVGRGWAKIQLEGDAHDFDNALFVDQSEKLNTTVLYLGNEPEGDPESLRFYLARAFPPTPSRRVEVLPGVVNGGETPVDASIALAVAVGGLTESRSAELRKYVETGGTVLYVAANAGAVASVSGLLLPETATEDLVVKEADVGDYAIIEQVDFSHPIFAPFSDAQFADFTRIHVWKHRSLPAGTMSDSRVLASFDNGDPAIMERRLGEGRVFVFAAGWQPEESQLALSTKFVPLMNGLLEYATGGPLTSLRMNVGEPLKLDRFLLDQPEGTRVVVTTPNGGETDVGATANVFNDAVTPGVYELKAGSNQARFAVNVAATEGATAPMALEQLESLGVRMDQGSRDPANIAAAAARKRQLKSIELEARQKFWQWLILAAIVTLFFETWLAGRLAAKRTPDLQGGTA